jgi:hypothetical protein
MWQLSIQHPQAKWNHTAFAIRVFTFLELIKVLRFAKTVKLGQLDLDFLEQLEFH